MKTELTGQELLALTFYSDDLNKLVSIRDFLKALLTTLWSEGESFSGKRPFGNSGWDADLVKCLILNEVLPGKIDSDGYLEEVDWDKATKFVVTKIIPFL